MVPSLLDWKVFDRDFKPQYKQANRSVLFYPNDMTGIKTNNKMQQLMDFNNVCYDKVLDQVKKGYQVTNLYVELLIHATVFEGKLEPICC